MKKTILITLVGFAGFVIFFSVPNICLAKSASPTRDTSAKTIYDKDSAKVEAVADNLEYLKNEKKVIAKGNVVITYGDTKLTSDYAEVYTDDKTAFARGHVVVFQGDTPTLQGTECNYDFENGTGEFLNGRSINPPWYGSGAVIRQIREGVRVVEDGSITTCNLENPHYSIRAKKATIYEKDKIVAKNVTFYILGKPVFWWPYYIIPLQYGSLPFHASAGYNNKYGAYVELSKGFSINKYAWGEFHADWRKERGFGAGITQDYKIETEPEEGVFRRWADGDITFYWTQDKKAPTPGVVDEEGNENPFSQTEDRDRARLSWRHRTDINPNTHIILRYHRVADEYFMQDFFEKEHRSSIQPNSFITLTHNTERYGSMIYLTKRMNSFEALVERLPQIRLDWKNQSFFIPRLYNESQISFDNLSKRHGRDSRDESVVRSDAYTRWYYPLKWKEIKFTPNLGFRGTTYTREKQSDNGHFRAIVEYGADLRTQFYKTFPVTFDKFGIEVNHLRHIFEPSVTYSGVISSMSDEKLEHFDYIDTLDDSAKITFGIENRLQTKRVINGVLKRVDIISLNTFLSYEIVPLERNGSGANFTDFNGEVTLRPYDWLQYQMRLDVDLDKDYVLSLENDFLVRKGRYKFLFGHRYVHDVDEHEGGNLFVFETEYIINDLWTVGGYVRWDAARNGLEEWQVSASRDLHDFILDFGYNVRDSLIDSTNNQLYFNFRMKAFPMIHLTGGASRASFSTPRIGETVAGANVSGQSFTTSH